MNDAQLGPGLGILFHHINISGAAAAGEREGAGGYLPLIRFCQLFRLSSETVPVLLNPLFLSPAFSVEFKP